MKNIKLKACRWIANRWIEILMFLIFLTVLLVEIFYFGAEAESEEIDEATDIVCEVEETSGFLETLQDKFYINGLVSILCPLIATVLSVSISVYSDTIYGLRIVEFRKLRKKDNYSLATMIIIPIVILTMCIVLYYFDLWLTITVLNAIALFYVIFFIIREIPLLTKNKKRIDKIITYPTNESLKKEKQEPNSLPSDYSYSDLDIALTNYVFSDGIEAALKMTGKNDIETISFLLEKSNNRIVAERRDTSANSLHLYKVHLKNAVTYISLLDGDRRVEIEKPDNMFCINILATAIEQIGLSFGNEKMLDEYSGDAVDIVNAITPAFLDPKAVLTNKDMFLARVSNQVLINTFSDNMLWYYKTILKMLNDPIYKDKTFDTTYVVFISIYLFYVSQRSTTDENFKKEINDLEADEISNIIQRQIIIKSPSDLETCSGFLFSLLNYYKYADIKPSLNPGNAKSDISIPFGEQYIIAWWIGLLRRMYSDSGDILVSDFINSLSEEDKKNYQLVYDYYGQTENFIGRSLIDELERYYVEYGIPVKEKTDVTKTTENSNKSKQSTSSLAESTKKLQDSFKQLFDLTNRFSVMTKLNEKVKKHPFYDASLKIDNSADVFKPYQYNAILTPEEVDEYINSFDHLINGWISAVFSNEIKSGRNQFKAVEDYNKLARYFNSQAYNLQGTNEKVEISDVPSFNNKAIRINATIWPGTASNELSSADIDKVIEQKYTLVNGLYKSNDSSTSGSDATYISKENLIEQISKKYRHLIVNLFYAVSIDFDNMFDDKNKENK